MNFTEFGESWQNLNVVRILDNIPFLARYITSNSNLPYYSRYVSITMKHTEYIPNQTNKILK